MDTRSTGVSHSGFDDFVLEVLDDRRGRGPRRISRRREYPVRLRTPAGDLQAVMRLPFDHDELTNRLLRVENAILWSGGQSRRVIPSERLRVVQEFGATMFQAALGNEAGGLYYQSRAMAERDRKGLRLKLRVEPPELAALPWEFLFDHQRSSFIGLSTRTPIVRDLGLPFTMEPLTVSGPLRILGMVSSPTGLDQLDIAREQSRVEKALAEPIATGAVSLRWLPGKTWEDLQSEIRCGHFHVFHFIGHGGFDATADQGLIALSDEEGDPYYLPADDLAMLLDDQDALRLVVLNSCDGARGGSQDIFSSTASILVRRAIPAVLAMQYEITDEAAIAFSKSFYRAIADGVPIDAAVANGRQAIRLSSPGSLEWATPVLYQRAPDGVLFALETSARATNGTSPGGPLEGPGGRLPLPSDSPTAGSAGATDLGAAPHPSAPRQASDGDATASLRETDALGGGAGASSRPSGSLASDPVSTAGSGSSARGLSAGRRLRGVVNRLFTSMTARATLLVAIPIVLLAALVIDPVPLIGVAAASGALVSIALAIGEWRRDPDSDPSLSSTSIAVRRMAAASCLIAGAGLVLVSVASGVPLTRGMVTNIGELAFLRQTAILLAGLGAASLGARVLQVPGVLWSRAGSGMYLPPLFFLGSLFAFLPSDGPGPVPPPVPPTHVAMASCGTVTDGLAAPATATVHDRQKAGSAMFRGTLSRSGGPIGSGEEEPAVGVLASSHDQMWSSAIVVDDKVFVGGNDGLVYGVDFLTGAALQGWPYDTRGIVYSSPIVADGVLYVASFTSVDGSLGELHAVDIATGGALDGWPRQVHAGIHASPVLADGTLLFGDIGGNFYQVDVVTGEAPSVPVGSPIWSSAAVVDGVAYFGTDSGVVSLGLSDQRVRWTFPSGPAMSSPALVAGTVYIGSDDGCVYALDADSGEELWQFKTGGKVFSSPAVSDGIVYIGSKDSMLYALDAETGAFIWRFDSGDRIWSSPALDDGVVYFGSDDGNLYAVDAVSGQERWRVDVSRRVLDLPEHHRWRQIRASPLVTGDYIVMGSFDGNVYVVTTGELAAPLLAGTPASPATPTAGATPVR